MTKTSRERRHFPIPIRWPQAGNDPSHPGHRGQCTLRSLSSSKRLPRYLLEVNLAGVQMPWPHPVSVTSIRELGAAIKSP